MQTALASMQDLCQVYKVNCEEEMESLGARLAKTIIDLKENRVLVLLNGCLGAGKTTFSRGFFEALGIQEQVSSPTYAILHSYASGSSLPVFHMDLYRLNCEEEFKELEVEEILSYQQAFIFVVEWADKFKELWHNLPNLRIFQLDIVLQPDATRLVEMKVL